MPDAYGPTTAAPFDADFDAPLDDSLFVDDRPLASPWVRLGAVMLDGVIAFGISLPFLIAAVAVGEGTGDDTLAGLLGLLWIGVLGAFTVYQMVLLSRQGQTVGKRMLKIQIVDKVDGSNPGFGRAVGLRSLVNGLIGAFIPFYSLVDALFIFSGENQTLHDRIASTVVVSNADVYDY